MSTSTGISFVDRLELAVGVDLHGSSARCRRDLDAQFRLSTGVNSLGLAPQASPRCPNGRRLALHRRELAVHVVSCRRGISSCPTGVDSLVDGCELAVHVGLQRAYMSKALSIGHRFALDGHQLAVRVDFDGRSARCPRVSSSLSTGVSSLSTGVSSLSASSSRAISSLSTGVSSLSTVSTRFHRHQLAVDFSLDVRDSLSTVSARCPLGLDVHQLAVHGCELAIHVVLYGHQLAVDRREFALDRRELAVDLDLDGQSARCPPV